MKTILFVEASIHELVALPWYMGQEDEDGSFWETEKGIVRPFETEELRNLYARADEVVEVSRLYANTNKRRVK